MTRPFFGVLALALFAGSFFFGWKTWDWTHPEKLRQLEEWQRKRSDLAEHQTGEVLCLDLPDGGFLYLPVAEFFGAPVWDGGH